MFKTHLLSERSATGAVCDAPGAAVVAPGAGAGAGAVGSAGSVGLGLLGRLLFVGTAAIILRIGTNY